MTTNFSPHQNKVLMAFKEIDTDIPIRLIYLSVYKQEPYTNRAAQMKLAPTFHAMNKKWERDNFPERILPGKLKQTYRLDTNRD